MDAATLLHDEVRELVRRHGVDPLTDAAALEKLVAEASADYLRRADAGLVPPLPDPEGASAEVIDALTLAITADPQVPITLDVENRVVQCGGVSHPVQIPESSHEALLAGKWDPIGDLIDGDAAIHATAGALPYMAFQP